MELVFDKSLMAAIIGAFEKYACALVAFLSREAGRVEKRVVFCVYDQSGDADAGNALLPAAFDIIVEGVFKAAKGGGDLIVKIDKILNFRELNSSEKLGVDFGLLRNFLFKGD